MLRTIPLAIPLAPPKIEPEPFPSILILPDVKTAKQRPDADNA